MNGVKHPDMANEVDVHMRIETTDQALRWIEHLVEHTEAARNASIFAVTAIESKTAYGSFLARQGSALGAMAALMRTGFISVAQHDYFRARALATNVASVTTHKGG